MTQISAMSRALNFSPKIIFYIKSLKLLSYSKSCVYSTQRKKYAKKFR